MDPETPERSPTEPNETDGSNEGIDASERVDPLDVEQAFDAPWQARAFAVALATTEEGAHSWAAFQDRLVAEIERIDAESETGVEAARPDAVGRNRTDALDADDGEEVYYEQWLAALSELLVDAGTLTPEEIDARTQAFAEGERTAEEWVEGERDHDHGDHGKGHSH